MPTRIDSSEASAHGTFSASRQRQEGNLDKIALALCNKAKKASQVAKGEKSFFTLRKTRVA
jgi:hypothetical protein